MKLTPLYRQALYIAGAYVIVSLLWIIFSDRVLESLVRDPDILGWAQTWKGCLFVLVTGVLLYFLIRREIARQAKLAEQNLSIARRYRELSELSPVGIYHTDAQGKITYVNPSALALAGLERSEEVMGDGWSVIVADTDRERVIAKWLDCVKRETIYRDEYRLDALDGKSRWILDLARPVFDHAGQLTGYIGTVTDTTSMNETAAQLQVSESFRRLIIELEPDCVKVLAPDGSLLEMNPAGLAMIDAVSLDQVKGKVMANLVAPEHRDAFVALHRRVMRGESGTLEFDIISLKGSRRHLETRAVPLTEDGRITGLLGVTRDVTEGRLSAELIRESEIRYRELFDSNPMAMCVWDPGSLKILAVNDAMVAGYGYSREEFLAMSLLDIRPEEDVHRLMAIVERSKQGFYAAGTWQHRKKNGEIIDVDIRSHPVRFGNRQVVLAQVTDVTSQRRVEAALAEEQALLDETTARLNHILTTSPTVLHSMRLKNDAFTPVWISDNVERIFGFTREEALRPGFWLQQVHPDDREWVRQRSREFNKQDALVDEFRFIKKSGEVLWLRAEARRVSTDSDLGAEIVGTWSDITEERKTQERLRLDAAAFESTRDGVMISDAESRIISVNRALLDATGYAKDELIGRTPNILRSGRHPESFYTGIWESLKETGHWQGEIWNRDKAGSVFPVWLTISAVYNDQSKPTHYVAIYTDISKLKQSQEELHRLSHFDPLTMLPNRLLLQSRLEHAIDQAQRRGSFIAVVFLDLDDFKKVNDSLGHMVGDELLSEVASRLEARVRVEDTLARLGGDEFVVLLESLARPEDAASVARDLLRGIATPFVLPGGHEMHVHGSIGISVFPADGSTPAELLRAADTAMYRAKDEGGDRFLFFTSEMSREVLAVLNMENALRQALVRKEFTLHFQPKFQLASHRVTGAEALLRWQSPDAGMVRPDEFIPVAERTGLIVPIGTWVIEAVCAQYALWRENGMPPLQLAVNVSARQFLSGELEETISSALERNQVPPHCLAVELTESMLMQRPDDAARILERLRQIGVRLALDDFGTGFSSLAYLTRFPMDTLKIDRSFVAGIETDPSARQIVNAIIDLAHGLRLETVAEGVETKEQEEFLRDLGCHYLQGYLFSRPLPPEEFAEFVSSNQAGTLRGRGRRRAKG